MSADTLVELLEKLQCGEIDIEAVVKQLQPLSRPPERRLDKPAFSRPMTAVTSDARVDLDRRRRCGFPEVVLCEGKTAESIIETFEALTRHGEDGFGTRVLPDQVERILQRFPDAGYNAVARTVRLPQQTKTAEVGNVAVITAGTSDRPIAEEAIETLRWMRCGVELIVDVGVAGPHRLQEQRERFAAADAVVVVAGMEGALPSVVGGCVDCPVIAVPTSVGYGASFGGVAALLGMLNSCASNVTVVNIDSGFKGGYVAGLIARRTASK